MIGLSISPKAGSPKSRASDRVQREREEQAGPMSTAKKIILLTTGYLIIILIAVVGGNPAIQAPKGIASRCVCVCVGASCGMDVHPHST
ncbi:hypothetical protein B484DRAFT_410092 [Ochromonadaceae sp. CCMP2298]|nr:hypothetical protein B484DRAFT_410092 [Ochromonadaceae sp. CCMP2298]